MSGLTAVTRYPFAPCFPLGVAWRRKISALSPVYEGCDDPYEAPALGHGRQAAGIAHFSQTPSGPMSHHPIAIGEGCCGRWARASSNFGVVAKREAEQRAELAAGPDAVVTVPFFDTDIYDMAGLLRLGRALWSAS
jgi:hypothetical protein